MVSITESQERISQVNSIQTLSTHMLIIQKEVLRLQKDTDDLFLQGDKQKATVLKQEIEDKRQIRAAGDAAYDALERSVYRLVELSSSRDDVSEQDPNILGIFHTAIGQFNKLSKTSQENTYELGTAVGDYEGFVGAIAIHNSKLDVQMSSWNREQKSAHESTVACQKRKVEYEQKVRKLDSELRDLLSERHSISGIIASGFSNSLDDRIRGTRDNIEDNKKAYYEEEDKEKWNKKLRIGLKDGRKVCLALKRRINALRKEFAREILRVHADQVVESSLWRGLLELSSMVEDPQFLASRDNSLRLVLKILKADDNKFGSGDRYAHVEERIKSAIVGRWGEDGLKRLLIAGDRRGPRGFLANE